MSAAAKPASGAIPWQDLLMWTVVVLVVYALRDVFLVAFLTFLLSYLVRSIVVALARRLRPGRESPGLERWLTLGTFAGILALLWVLAVLIGPQLILQGRLMMTHAQRVEPQDMIIHLLGRTVGAYLFDRTYGAPDDPRYQAALRQFAAEGRSGEGAYAGFGRLQAQVQAGFEIAYEGAERQRLRDQVLRGGAAGKRFDQWFLAVKAPALVAQHRAAYLARWQATAGQAPVPEPKDLERHLGELALTDLKTHPAEREKLVGEWEEAVVAEEWYRLQASPAYSDAFRDWFAGQQGKAEVGPYDYATYLALRDAYPEGMAAFNQIFRSRVAQAAENSVLLQQDFRRAMETDLARKWWASSPVAASIREHLQQDATRAAEAVADRLEGGMQALIAVPAQIGTALLLTILITFDMPRLKQGALGLRQSRIAGLYARLVPNLVAVARLIGRSFAAQGLIAVFNSLLTFALLQILGLGNELLLCSVVFIASFIPVLGVILSAIPIALQALLQPDGSLALALYALLGIAAIHAIEATVLSPRIVGKILHLHPVLVMAVLIVGEHLFGIWGLLLGVPVSVYIIHAAVLAEAIPGVYEPATAD